MNSLEEVIKHFLKLATEKAEQAQEEAKGLLKGSLEVDDLEAEHTPETLMLKSVSAESDKDRADRELVTPWFKFLWETYRTAGALHSSASQLLLLQFSSLPPPLPPLPPPPPPPPAPHPHPHPPPPLLPPAPPPSDHKVPHTKCSR